VPRIIISGAPASGKGTQCEFIKAEYPVVHLSAGDMLREAIKAGTEIGLQAKEFVENGALVPDEVMVGVILDRLQENDCKTRGWLLDGFPRTSGQAEALQAANITCDLFLQLDVSEELLLERVIGRRLDPETGKIYHMKYSPPESDEIRDRLTQRDDDTEEKFKTRIDTYLANTESIISHFTDKLVTVRVSSADQTPASIYETIKSTLLEKLPLPVTLEALLTPTSPLSAAPMIVEEEEKEEQEEEQEQEKD
jgi:adenylate kinase